MSANQTNKALRMINEHTESTASGRGKQALRRRNRFKEARELRGLSQSELAARAGMEQSWISQFEIGARKPSFDTFRLLADALEVSADYLLERVDVPYMVFPIDPMRVDFDKLNFADRSLVVDFVQLLVTRRAKS